MPAAAVLIASSDLLPALEQRAAAGGEALRFSDAQPLEALEAITRHRPPLVVLERFFAATPRGAALINRIKADPGCANAEIRVLSHTGDYSRVIQAGSQAGSAGKAGEAGLAGKAGLAGHAGAAGKAGPSAQPASAAAPTAPVAPASPATPASPASPASPATPASPASPASPAPPAHLDWRGTRRHPRFRIRDGVTAQIDGKDAAIIDLSAGGAQVVSSATLRPNQKLRISLPLEPDAKLRATVAWASFELPKNPSDGPRYRAGIEFNDEDPRIGPFAERNRV